MKKAIEMHGQCDALTRAGMRCGNAAYRKSRCRRHMSKATHSADGERVRKKRDALLGKPGPDGLFVFSYQAGRVETKLAGIGVMVRHNGQELQLTWNKDEGAFELRAEGTKVCNALLIAPRYSNSVLIKVQPL